MRVSNLVAVTLVIVMSVSWLSILFYPSVQDFMQANPFWNGLKDFNRRFEARMVNSLDEVELEPGGSVLVVIPYLPYPDKDLKAIERFVSGGGTLLLMDDYGYGNQILQGLGLEMVFYGDPMLDPFFCYRNQWLPLVVDFTPELQEAAIETVILNHATALAVSAPYQVIAWSSRVAFIDLNGDSSWNQGEEPKGPFPVAAKASLGMGTVIAVADPSILISSMVGRGDNEAFMRKLVSMGGESPTVAVDTSHLPKTPLDRSRDAWEMVKERVSTPYSQVLLVGMALAFILMPLWRKGDGVEQQ